MKRLARAGTLLAASFVLAIGTAAGAELMHSTGASVRDVHAIKAAVTRRFRDGLPASVVWYIAAEGSYAVAFDGCGPGACDENQLVRRGARWIVTCFTTSGKGQFGTCLVPPKIEWKLRHEALWQGRSFLPPTTASPSSIVESSNG